MKTLERMLNELCGEIGYLGNDILGMQKNGVQNPAVKVGFGFEENAGHATPQYFDVVERCRAALDLLRELKER